jgi:hypothetical protein
VLAKATYVEDVTLSSSTTSAATLQFFGGGATLMHPAVLDEVLLNATDVGFDIHDVTLIGSASGPPAVDTGTVPCSLENVTIENATTAINVANTVLTITNIQISNAGNGISLFGGATLTLDRAVIHDVRVAPISVANVGDGSVNITNLMAYNAGSSLELAGANGTIAFSTIGATTGTGSAAALDCGPSVTLDSTIVWNTTGAAISGTCQVVHSSIAGPTAVMGTANANPLFANELQGDYHLTADSPAIDQVGTGPATDFEGDARPQGSAFDIGADEYKP